MGYQVDVTLAGEAWSLTETDGEVTDGISVLSGLDFGWALPGGVWPQQPQPMGASLALTVPNFADLAVAEGDVCTIEVKATADGPIIARFYGDVTDYHATPRTGRPGVTLEVTAVDYTVRTAELDGLVSGIITIPPPDLDVVEFLWPSGGLGPGVSDTPPFGGVWTSPSRVLTALPFTDDRPSIRGTIDQLLLQAVNVDDWTRMILSPVVAGGLLTAAPSARLFTLDTIHAEPSMFNDPAFLEIPASAVRLDQLDWSNVKGQTINRVLVTGWGGDTTNQTSAFTPGVPIETYAAIATTFLDESSAEDVATFYAGIGFNPWQLDKVTIPVTRAGVAAIIPADLFPDWTAAEGDPARAACYSRALRFSDVDTTRTPDGSDEITGVLTGARCRIAGGDLELDLTIRRPITPP